MNLNLLLLLAMVATNILSLYHLSSTLQSKPPSPPPVPEYLIRQLQTIRATINHLTRLHPQTAAAAVKPTKAAIPSDILLYTHLSPIASSCSNHPDLLYKYMNYTPFSLCPLDHDVAEALILRGCHPLPRRRCFSRTITKIPSSSSFPTNPFSPLPDDAVIWTKYSCKSFQCLTKQNVDLGFDMKIEKSKLQSSKSDLDLPISQLIQISKSAKSPLRLALDIGGGTGTFAAQMKLQNVTVLTTTLNFGVPNNEAVSLRGLIPLHAPLQQRLPVFDGVLDLVRCSRAVNRWIPTEVMEFLFYDVDRVLRGGGYLWMDHFFSKSADLKKVYSPLIEKLGYKKVKWAVENKTDSSGLKNGEAYLTALLQKPVSR